MDKKEKDIRLQGVSGWLSTFLLSTLMFVASASIDSALWAVIFGWLGVGSGYNAWKSWYGWR